MLVSSPRSLLAVIVSIIAIRRRLLSFLRFKKRRCSASTRVRALT
ncbi:hypothetical protein WQQ_02530 [Hydrocarboniphaga effusa AP103]|uniref:Uncharacterized protein n=1 Tax=Hydrocarboniphaga effusa AP103 TaxID=1172194 RepID=I8I2K5_9GAMM|nr:hypothetical protein WQQ_00660 [Hydrocarboniphaga effusa AP103]EIT70116.1 hypothetical protein WQQ_02530 [Hydrocarboniphaga effusa AP103]